MTDSDKFPCPCRDYEWFTRPEPTGGSQYRTSVFLRRAIELLDIGEEPCRASPQYPVGYHRSECRGRAMLQLHIIQTDVRLRELAVSEAAAEVATQTEPN